jgi:hypothetical protein
LEEKGMLMANRIEAIWVGAKIEYWYPIDWKSPPANKI